MAVVGGYCWWLLLVPNIGGCCWWLLLVGIVGGCCWWLLVTNQCCCSVSGVFVLGFRMQ